MESTCCRLCMSDAVDDLRSIVDTIDDEDLPGAIFLFVGVQIMADDILSTKVCIQCIEKVQTWQSFKLACGENQTKQLLSLNIGDISDVNIEIKEEPMDPDVLISEVFINGEILVKNEEIEEEHNELPPPLTPQRTKNGNVEVVTHSPYSQMARNDEDGNNSQKCNFCGKLFSSSGSRKKHEKNIHGLKPPPPLTRQVFDTGDSQLASNDKDGNHPRRCNFCWKWFSSSGNRSKHEKMIHGLKSRSSATESEADSQSQETSQNSIHSKISSKPNREHKQTSSVEEKMLRATGMKISQRHPTQTSQEYLSRIENSYIEKCKAMITMHRTFKCACHNASFESFKGLSTHLQKVGIWFPTFTCYHCMITFTDRSPAMRHFYKCPKKNLESLVKLSNLKERSEIKTRLYQNYKCTQCEFRYSFHEDFCTHVDEYHSLIDLPYFCSCGRIFTTLEDYKSHAYVSCLVDFYCDICFVTVNTLDAFQNHAATVHDASEGFTLFQDNNFRQKRSSASAATKTSPRQGAKRQSAVESNSISGKRRTSYRAPTLESNDSSDRKVINPLGMQKIPGKKCTICMKKYSTNNNMWRHYLTHFEKQGQETEEKGEEVGQLDDAIYGCSNCGGMFNTKEWKKHKDKYQNKTCKNDKSTMMSATSKASIILTMCEICDRTFTSKEQLKEHKLSHEMMPVLHAAEPAQDEEKSRKFLCKICNKNYAALSSLWKHNTRVHPQNKLFNNTYPKKCEYCEKILKSGPGYYVHTQMHERNNQKQKHKNPPKLQASTEEKTNKNDTESYHMCKRCYKVFSTRSNLTKHMKSHDSPKAKATKKTDKKVWCNVCHCAFDSATSLKRHKSEGHDDDDDTMPTLSAEASEVNSKALSVFTCDVCAEMFTTKIALNKHKERHSGEVSTAVKSKQQLVCCKYCKISFASRFYLTIHMKQEHEEAKPASNKEDNNSRNLSCNVCGKSFVSASALCSHQGWHKRSSYERTPSKESKYNKSAQPVENQQNPEPVQPKTEQHQCSTCKAVFPNNAALQIHILEKHRNVNATILPARCAMCNLNFNSQEEYDQHKRFHVMVNKQPKTKTFRCTQCPLGFSKMELLTNHVRQSHQDVQEHRCHHCDRVFDKANSFNIHLKVHEKQRLVTGNYSSPKLLSSAKSSAGPKPLYSG